MKGARDGETPYKMRMTAVPLISGLQPEFKIRSVYVPSHMKRTCVESSLIDKSPH